MQTRYIGQCPRCERITFVTEGYCDSGYCLPGESQLAVVRCCQWQERSDESETLVCQRCGKREAPLPLCVSALKACDNQEDN